MLDYRPSYLDFDETGTIVIGCSKTMPFANIPYGVKTIGKDAFRDCVLLRRVVIPNSVTEICHYAFRGCSKLNSIEIPNSVHYLGSHSFQGCQSIESIDFPNSIMKIGGYAFMNCTALRDIEIPEGVTEIGHRAFYECSSLISVSLPSNIKKIGVKLFEGCTSLREVTLPDNLEVLNRHMFDGCINLLDIKIPASVKEIDSHVFSGCSKLQSINLPEDVSVGDRALACLPIESIFIPKGTSLHECAICKCNKLTKIEVSRDNTQYKSEDGVLYSKDFKEIVKYPCGLRGKYEIKKTTEKIHNVCFCHSCINSVIINDKIKQIGYRAFNGCEELTELHLRHEHPEEINIGEDAFAGLEKCTLYVPIGTGYAYRHDERFKVFKEVKIER